MAYIKTIWRLLITPPARGSWNMAVDEAVLEAAVQGESPPTLRLYAWEPACLSLGYSQPYQDVDLSGLEDQGWDLVRRPTGGRAILHTDELTYAVIGPAIEPRLTGSVLESYRRLSEALLAALHRLGVPAEARAQPQMMGSSEEKGPVCFEVPSNYEITVGGKKLIGSAQARRKDGVLQHGSLPLFGDLGRIACALAFPTSQERAAATERIYTRATTVEKALGAVIPWDSAAQAFVRAFQEVLNLEFGQAPSLTPAESARAEELVRAKYGHPGWTQRI
jgi:lipoate-protein ligase A